VTPAQPRPLFSQRAPICWNNCGLAHYLMDCRSRSIHFRRKKTGKPFDVPLFPHAATLVERLKAEGRLFVGKPVVKWRNPRKALAAACERLDLHVYEPRALRRCFIIHALEQGIDPRVVAKW
jgi:integrase